MSVYKQLASDPKPEHLAEAIFHVCTCLNPISSEDPDYHYVMRRLANLKKIHFKMFGTRSGQQQDNAEVVDALHLAASPQMAKSNLVEFPLPITDKSGLIPHVEVLLSIHYITDLMNVKKGIKYCRLCLNSPHSDLPSTLRLLGLLLYCLFHLTGNIYHLHESINFHHNLIKLPGVLLQVHRIALDLIHSLVSWLSLFNDRRDADKILELFAITVTNTSTSTEVHL